MSSSVNKYNPFPGLRAYGFQERKYFAGRERQKHQLLKLMGEGNFITVIGSNGVGKTSFVNSEILPELLQGYFMKGVENWKAASFRPGKTPLGAFATALSRVEIIRSTDEEKITPNLSDKFEDILRENKYGLIEIIEQYNLTKNNNLLLFIDHLDDLLFYDDYRSSESSKKDIDIFIKRLVEIATQSAYPVTVIATLRTEIAGHFSRFPGLAEIINKNQFLLSAYEPKELKSVFEKITKESGIKFSKDFITHVKEYYRSSPLILGEFQHAMKRCIDVWHEQGSKGEVDLPHLNAVGGLKTSIPQQLDDVYGYLSIEHKETCKLLFQSITETSASGTVFTVPRSIHEIAQITNKPSEEIVDVARLFSTQQCGFLKVYDTQDITGRLEKLESILDESENKISVHSEITIAQDFALREWSRLDKWIKEEHLNSNVYREIAKDVERNEPPYEGEKLLSTWKWYQNSHPHAGWAHRYYHGYGITEEFILKSKKLSDGERLRREAEEYSRQQKSRRNRNIKLAFSLIAFVLILLAIRENRVAQNEKKAAIMALDTAKVARESAKAAIEVADNEKRLAGLATIDAANKQQDANEALEVADEATKLAKDATRTAQKMQIKADKLKIEADQLTNTVSVKSEELGKAEEKIKTSKIKEDYLGILERVREYSDESIKILKRTNNPQQKQEAAKLATIGYAEFLKTKDPMYADINDTILDHTQKKLYSSLTLAFQKVGGSQKLSVVNNGIYISKNAQIANVGGSGEFLIGTNDDDYSIFKVQIANGNVESINKIASAIDEDKKLKGIKSLSYSSSAESFLVSHLPFDQTNRFLSKYDAEGNKNVTQEMPALVESIYAYGPDDFIVFDQNGVIYEIKKHATKGFTNTKIHDSKSELRATEFHELSSQIFLAFADRKVNQLTIKEGNVKETSVLNLVEFESEITSLKYVASKNWLFVGNRDGEIYIYDLNSKKCIYKSLHEHAGNINCFALSSDEKMLVTGGRDKIVNIWNLEQLSLYTLGNPLYKKDYQPIEFYESESIRDVSFVDNNWILVVYSTEGLSSGKGGASLLPLDFDITGKELKKLVN